MRHSRSTTASSRLRVPSSPSCTWWHESAAPSASEQTSLSGRHNLMTSTTGGGSSTARAVGEASISVSKARSDVRSCLSWLGTRTQNSTSATGPSLAGATPSLGDSGVRATGSTLASEPRPAPPARPSAWHSRAELLVAPPPRREDRRVSHRGMDSDDGHGGASSPVPRAHLG